MISSPIVVASNGNGVVQQKVKRLSRALMIKF